MEASYLLHRRLVPELVSSSLHNVSSISTLGPTRGGFVSILMYQSMSALLYYGESATSESLGVECPQPSLGILGELHISSLCIRPIFLVEHAKG